MIDKVKEFTGDLGMDIVKSSLQNAHDSRKIRNDIIEFVQDRQELSLVEGNSFNEIDFQGYLIYIRENMLNEIKKYICAVDYDEAEHIKQAIMAKASAYEKKSCYSSGSILYITENCINIIKTYYNGKLDGNNQLLAHITVQTIVGKMDENIGEIKEILKEQDKGRKELIDKVTKVGNMIQNSGKNQNSGGNTNGFYLAYCEQAISYADELKEWFKSNSIGFDDCCYVDEYSINEDIVSQLRDNKILILLVEESFLRNIRCVYGLAEVVRQENVIEWIFPVIIDRSIFSERNRTERIVYWEEKERELRIDIEKVDRVQHVYSLVGENLVKYERTAQSIDEFIVWMARHAYTMSEIKEIVKKKS